MEVVPRAESGSTHAKRNELRDQRAQPVVLAGLPEAVGESGNLRAAEVESPTRVVLEDDLAGGEAHAGCWRPVVFEPTTRDCGRGSATAPQIRLAVAYGGDELHRADHVAEPRARVRPSRERSRPPRDRCSGTGRGRPTDLLARSALEIARFHRSRRLIRLRIRGARARSRAGSRGLRVGRCARGPVPLVMNVPRACRKSEAAPHALGQRLQSAPATSAQSAAGSDDWRILITRSCMLTATSGGCASCAITVADTVRSIVLPPQPIRHATSRRSQTLRRASAPLTAALAAVLPLLVTALAACGDGGSGEDVDKVLDQTFRSEKKLSSGKLNLDATARLEGAAQLKGPVNVKMSGPFEGLDEKITETGKIPEADPRSASECRLPGVQGRVHLDRRQGVRELPRHRLRRARQPVPAVGATARPRPKGGRRGQVPRPRGSGHQSPTRGPRTRPTRAPRTSAGSRRFTSAAAWTSTRCSPTSTGFSSRPESST